MNIRINYVHLPRVLTGFGAILYSPARAEKQNGNLDSFRQKRNENADDLPCFA